LIIDIFTAKSLFHLKEIDAHSIMATIYSSGRKLIDEENGEEKSMAQGH
jgi:hypothetical protein